MTMSRDLRALLMATHEIDQAHARWTERYEDTFCNQDWANFPLCETALWEIRLRRLRIKKLLIEVKRDESEL